MVREEAGGFLVEAATAVATAVRRAAEPAGAEQAGRVVASRTPSLDQRCRLGRSRRSASRTVTTSASRHIGAQSPSASEAAAAPCSEREWSATGSDASVSSTEARGGRSSGTGRSVWREAWVRATRQARHPQNQPAEEDAGRHREGCHAQVPRARLLVGVGITAYRRVHYAVV